MSAPKLILLTGPAAVEAAQVFSDDCHCCCPEGDPHRTWDEVRDYWEAPRCIAGVPDAVAIEYGIREYPGGEAWLVGLVLPALPETVGPPATSFPWNFAVNHRGQPARLAILAPEPPPLLVERVRAWGGEVWECTTCERSDLLAHQFTECTPEFPPCIIVDGVTSYISQEHTWPEAVRAALGEVAP